MDEISGSFHLMSKHYNGNMILCCVEIDGIPSRDFLYRKLHNIVNHHPNLRYTPTETKGVFRNTFHWKRDVFNMEDHFVYTEKKRFDNRNFRCLINKLLGSTFPQGLPEWQCHYVTYKKSNKSFIIWKCHHTYGDGFLISEYLKKFADTPSIHYPKRNRAKPSLYKTIYSFIVTFIMLLHFIFIYKKDDLDIDLPNAETDPALFYHCKTWDINDIKKLKNHYRVTVNDLLYTLICKSLRKYCNKPINVSSLSVFNLRDYAQDEDLVNVDPNNIGFMLVADKIGDEGVSELLGKYHEKFENYKNSPMTYIVTMLLRYVYYISPRLVVNILSFLGNKSTFGISNFRTFSECNHIEGCKVVNISNMVVPYGVGMLFTIVSYDDKITLNVTYRERNLSHPDKFIECLDQIYGEVMRDAKI